LGLVVSALFPIATEFTANPSLGVGEGSLDLEHPKNSKLIIKMKEIFMCSNFLIEKGRPEDLPSNCMKNYQPVF
jgi:hypothetical protein